MGRATYLSSVLLLLGHPSAAQTEYIVTDLGTLPGYADSYAGGINNRGQIIAWGCDPTSGICRALLLTPKAPPDRSEELRWW